MQSKKTIRQLLEISREELTEYAVHHNLTWREDASNAQDDYKRNYLRHRIVPLLKELNPSLEATFARNMERLYAAWELTKKQMQALRNAYVSHHNQEVRISKKIFETLNH